MALEKGTDEFIMFGDFFQLCKKYWDVKDTDDYWNELIQSASVFVEKYKHIPLAVKLAVTFLETQNNRAKE